MLRISSGERRVAATPRSVSDPGMARVAPAERGTRLARPAEVVTGAASGAVAAGAGAAATGSSEGASEPGSGSGEAGAASAGRRAASGAGGAPLAAVLRPGSFPGESGGIDGADGEGPPKRRGGACAGGSAGGRTRS